MEIKVDPITQGHLDRGIEVLVDEFRGVFSRPTIERYVNESLQSLPAARFSDFVPVLVHRFARERLHALGQVQGTVAKDVPEVLFVCVHNSGRSQMAAALLHQRAAGLVHVRSAGSDPAEEINPNVVQALSELGIDLSQEFPKPLTDEIVQAADVVITMGCGDACPIYPGKRYEDWTVDNPAGQESRSRPPNPRPDRPARRRAPAESRLTSRRRPRANSESPRPEAAERAPRLDDLEPDPGRHRVQRLSCDDGRGIRHCALLTVRARRR